MLFKSIILLVTLSKLISGLAIRPCPIGQGLIKWKCTQCADVNAQECISGVSWSCVPGHGLVNNLCTPCDKLYWAIGGTSPADYTKGKCGKCLYFAKTCDPKTGATLTCSNGKPVYWSPMWGWSCPV